MPPSTTNRIRQQTSRFLKRTGIPKTLEKIVKDASEKIIHGEDEEELERTRNSLNQHYSRQFSNLMAAVESGRYIGPVISRGEKEYLTGTSILDKLSDQRILDIYDNALQALQTTQSEEGAESGAEKNIRTIESYIQRRNAEPAQGRTTYSVKSEAQRKVLDKHTIPEAAEMIAIRSRVHEETGAEAYEQKADNRKEPSNPDLNFGNISPNYEIGLEGVAPVRAE